MNLIDRYVFAVCRSLPPKQRSDIEQELRGLIEDMLQRRTSGRPAEEADIEAVLLELGHPGKLAENYRGTSRYLIGPSYFEMYWLILRIVLGAVTLGIAVAFIIRSAMNPPDASWQLVADFLGSIYSALIGAFGMTTLVFALIEYFGGSAIGQIQSELDKWKPKDLPQIPVPKLRIPRSEPIVALIFILIFILVINFDSDLIGIYINTGGSTQVTPLLSDVFKTYLPWINLSLAASLVLESFKLIFGRWNLGLILGSVAQKVLGLVIGLRIFADSKIFNAAFFSKLNELFEPSGNPVFATLPDKISRILTIVVIVGFVIDMLTLVVKSVRLAIDRHR